MKNPGQGDQEDRNQYGCGNDGLMPVDLAVSFRASSEVLRNGLLTVHALGLALGGEFAAMRAFQLRGQLDRGEEHTKGSGFRGRGYCSFA